jgi:hypothetical protein
MGDVHERGVRINAKDSAFHAPDKMVGSSEVGKEGDDAHF